MEEGSQHSEGKRTCAQRAVSAHDRAADVEAVVAPLPEARSFFDLDLRNLSPYLAKLGDDYGGFERNPDFQRGHVWTEGQQIAYVEGMLRGTVPRDLRVLQLNIPHWNDDEPEGDLPLRIELIDGLQRLTALERAIAGELELFGRPPAFFRGTRYDLCRPNTWTIKVKVFTFAWRADLLAYYLAINAGGTPHSESEIDRVRELLAAARHAADNTNPRRMFAPGA